VESIAKWIGGVALLGLLTPISWDAWQTLQFRRTAERRAEALVGVADTAMQAGDVPQAVLALQRARELAPSDQGLHARLVQTRARHVADAPERLKVDAALALQVELALTPDDEGDRVVRALVLGHIAEGRGDPQAARDHFRRAAEMGPDDPRARYAAARGLMHRGLADEALVHFSRAVDLAPKDPRYRGALGQALLKLKKWERAEKELAAVVEEAPSAALWEALAEARMSQDKFADAMAPLRQAAGATTDRVKRAQLQARLGMAHFKAGESTAAVAAFRASLAVRPHAATWYNLGIAYNASGELKSAVQAYERVIAEEPNNAAARLTLMTTLARDGQLERARELAGWLRSRADEPHFSHAAAEAQRFLAETQPR
jgi:tetratricopeptide (TPR) repeat protein